MDLEGEIENFERINEVESVVYFYPAENKFADSPQCIIKGSSLIYHPIYQKLRNFEILRAINGRTFIGRNPAEIPLTERIKKKLKSRYRDYLSGLRISNTRVFSSEYF